MNCFSSSHPIVLIVYFISVFVVTMFTTNPLLLIVAMLGGIIFFIVSENQAGLLKEFAFYLFLFIIISLTNPLFSHNGVTTLFFLNGNPITLEAILCGVNIATMLISILYWFKCFNLVLTGDKLLFLFGKLSPKISLLISSVLRFIPLFKIQSAKIRQTQKAMGLYATDTWSDKLKGMVREYSSLMTWALENAIDTGSSMKARGYGLKGRSHYALYHFKKSDVILLAIILSTDAIIVAVMARGYLDFSFYPEISSITFNIYSISAVIAYALLSFLPLIIEAKEGLRWKYYISKI